MKVKDLIFDKLNANLGTQRGRGLIEKSLQKYGAGRSILIDKNNRIIAGNKTAEVAGEIGIENVRIIETNGKEIIAVKRKDLDLSKKGAARELAIADNRSGELSLDWDIPELQAMKADGIDLEGLGFSDIDEEKLFGKSTDDDDFYEDSEKLKKFKEARHKSKQRGKDKSEVNFWCCLVFQSWEQKQEFLKKTEKEIPSLYGMYINGEAFAKKFGINITINKEKPFKNIVEKKLAELSDESSDNPA